MLKRTGAAAQKEIYYDFVLKHLIETFRRSNLTAQAR
jgi:hypothetical protein